MARQSKAWINFCNLRRGGAWLGEARQGKARHGSIFGVLGAAWLGEAMQGTAWRGKVQISVFPFWQKTGLNITKKNSK